jgi:hypothetical protein
MPFLKQIYLALCINLALIPVAALATGRQPIYYGAHFCKNGSKMAVFHFYRDNTFTTQDLIFKESNTERVNTTTGNFSWNGKFLRMMEYGRNTEDQKSMGMLKEPTSYGIEVSESLVGGSSVMIFFDAFNNSITWKCVVTKDISANKYADEIRKTVPNKFFGVTKNYDLDEKATISALHDASKEYYTRPLHPQGLYADVETKFWQSRVMKTYTRSISNSSKSDEATAAIVALEVAAAQADSLRGGCTLVAKQESQSVKNVYIALQSSTNIARGQVNNPIWGQSIGMSLGAIKRIYKECPQALD